MRRPSLNITAIVYSLVMLAGFGTISPCSGRTVLGAHNSPHEISLKNTRDVPHKLFAEVSSRDETGTEVDVEKPQRYRTKGNVDQELNQAGMEKKTLREGNHVKQGNDDRKFKTLLHEKNVNAWNMFQVTKEETLLEKIPSFVDLIGEVDAHRENYLPSWLRRWIKSIISNYKPGGGQGPDEGETTSEAVGETTGNTTEDGSNWMHSTEETTPTTNTPVTTTTEDVMAEYCNNACKEGTAGLECGCPEHPIG